MASAGIFQKWLLCLPMLVIFQSSSYNVFSLSLLAVSFLLYYTSWWWPYFKVYSCLTYLITLLRYRRVEKHCDNCERHLMSQLNSNGDEDQQKSTLFPMLSDSQSYITVDHPTSVDACEVKIADKSKSPQLIGWRLRGVRRFPWRVLSRHWGKVANTRFKPAWINTFLIWLYAKWFGCNVREAQHNLTEYATLGQFFIRCLKPGVRPICTSSSCLLTSPADGTISHAGMFTGGFLEQVKGVHYSLNYFLGLQKKGKNITHASMSQRSAVNRLLRCKDGSTALMQAVIYLSPGDYHRFHSPADCYITHRRHFPGELLSVRPSTVKHLPGLLHLNERVAWFGQWEYGFFSMTAVAATNVGHIAEDDWHGDSDREDDLKTNQAYGLRRNCTFLNSCAQKGKKSLYYSEKNFVNAKKFVKGQPFGHFNFGSTIVLLFEAPKYFTDFVSVPGQRVSVGQNFFCKLVE